MKLISLDRLRTFKSKLNFGTLEYDYYIEGINTLDKSKCKIAFPKRQTSKNYYYKIAGYNRDTVTFNTSSIKISEFIDFLNLFASFCKDKLIYASGSFTYNSKVYNINSAYGEGFIKLDSSLIFNISSSEQLTLSSDKTITNVNLDLSQYYYNPK